MAVATPSAPVPGDRGGRTSGLVYTGIGAVLVILIAALTFTAAQSPPPAIAELAPSAVQQIKDAPDAQTSNVGEGEGGGGEGAAAVTTTTTPAGAVGPDGAPVTVEPVIERPRVRRCVGSPPRQIEDPQAPPCVPYWTGDNGGATSPGVTATEIKIAVPKLPEVHERYQAFFNNRFELYGRKIELQEIVTGGSCEQLKAGAAIVHEEMKAFASMSLFKQENCYMEELARRRIVGVGDDTVFTASELNDLHPYVWLYPMAVDEVLTGLGQWACSRLAGAPARFAEGVDSQTRQPMALTTRKFGLMVQPYASGHPIDPAPLDRALKGCGAELATTFTYGDDIGAGPSTNAALQMQQNGVTSVFCLCGSFSNLYLPSAAAAQGYYPEWLVSSYALNDATIFVKTFWPESRQRVNVLGLSVKPRQWTFDDSPHIWAIKEVDPGFDAASEAAAVGDGQWKRFYRMLLVLASGIQLAGPNLTPETFAAGLQRAQFPNPVTGLQAGRVGFGKGDHGFTNDFNELYWSDEGISPYGDGPGTLCYVEGGSRRVLGRWPRGDQPFFALPCDSGFQRAPNPTG